MPDLTGRLTVRADGGHAPPLNGSDKVINLVVIAVVDAGEMSGVESN